LKIDKIVAINFQLSFINRKGCQGFKGRFPSTFPDKLEKNWDKGNKMIEN
jgi:hypothetical protein